MRYALILGLILVGIWMLIANSMGVVDLQFQGSSVEGAVRPGDTIHVLINITNRGDEPAKDLKLFVRGSEALIPYRTLYDLEDLNPNSLKQVVIPVKVSKEAREGNHLLELTGFYSTQQQLALSQIYYLGIHVKRWVYVDIQELRYHPERVQPGQNFSIIIKLKNQGDYPAKNIRVVLAFEVVQQQQVQPGQPFSPTQLVRPELEYVKIPFIPLGDFIGFLDWLAPNQSAELEFMLSSDRSTREGDYPIPILIYYQDEWGREFDPIKNVIGVSLRGIPRLEISRLRTDPEKIVQGQPVMVSISLENTGTGEARGSVAELYSDHQLIARDYLGSIKQDDISSAVFDLTIPEPGAHSYLLIVNYTDISGNQYSSSKSILLNVHPRSEISPIIPVGVLVGIFSIGLLIWKLRR